MLTDFSPQQNTASFEEVLDINQASLLIKRKPKTIYDMVYKKKIPHAKPSNGKLVFFRSELMEWLKSFSVPIEKEIA